MTGGRYDGGSGTTEGGVGTSLIRLTGPFSSYRPFFVLPGKPGIYEVGWRPTGGTGCSPVRRRVPGVPGMTECGVGSSLFRLTGPFRLTGESGVSTRVAWRHDRRVPACPRYDGGPPSTNPAQPIGLPAHILSSHRGNPVPTAGVQRGTHVYIEPVRSRKGSLPVPCAPPWCNPRYFGRYRVKPGIYEGGGGMTGGTGFPRYDERPAWVPHFFVLPALFRLTGETRYLRGWVAAHRGYRVSPV